jgi:hypothetical protein
LRKEVILGIQSGRLIAEDEYNSLERLMVKHPDIKQWKEILGIQEYAKDRKPYWNMLKTRGYSSEKTLMTRVIIRLLRAKFLIWM